MASPERHAHRGPKAPPRPPFPPEVPVYGPSRAAVRSVAEGLLRALPSGLRAGLVAHPSDPAPQWTALPDEGRRIRLESPGWDGRDRRAALADCDIVIVEGRPDPGRPGILVLPEGGHGNTQATQGSGRARPGSEEDPAGPALLACVGRARPAELPDRIPLIAPDRPDALASLVLEDLRSRAAPLLGLVLGGGRSERMGADKAALDYHGRPQTHHVLGLLAPHCSESFVSCRAEQAAGPAFAGLPQIHDAFLGLGPLGGILSALRARPGAAFLVVACDLPHLDAATLAALVAGRDPLRAATAFAGAQDGLPEPLCAVYEPRAYARALQLLGQGVDCPRKLILNSSSALLAPPDLRALRNVNDPGEFRAAKASLP